MAGSGETKGRAIFISYRRDDSEGEAGRLYDDLVRAYGDDSVFMDVSGIQPGLDFRKAIDANVATCGVLLAVLGPTWATVTDADGHRRLDNTNDFVRLEIASALSRNIAVIPVLVHSAKMPPLDQLPDDLKDLRYRNSVELTHARWNSDVALLVDALKSYVTLNTAHQTETVHATVPVQLPAPQPAKIAEPVKKSKLGLWIGIGTAVVIVLAAVLFAVTRIGSSPAPQPTPVIPAKASVPTKTSPANPVTLQPQPQPVVSTGESALLGKWKNSNEPGGGDDLDHIAVADFGGQTMVQAWGKCGDHFCNWGSKKATLNGDTAVTETWNLHNNPQETRQQRSATLSIQPSSGGLRVTVQNTFHMPNGHTVESFNPLQFVKAP